MPGFTAAGDQPYQIWMTHTPQGTINDNAPKVDRDQNELVAYSGDAISIYTHCGTHIDALNHFGYYGKIFNNFTAHQHLGSRHWQVAGVDKHPPVIARGLLLDVPALLGVGMLPASYGISPDELAACLHRQQLAPQLGDVILIRTGRMRAWPDPHAYGDNGPGITLDAARYLAHHGAILIGADTLSLEQIPAVPPNSGPANWNIVHCYLLGEAGIPILENANLEELAANHIHEFAFIAAPIRLRGATGAPVRPVAVAVNR